MVRAGCASPNRRAQRVPAGGRSNGNGHQEDEEPEQQTLFSWAEFMAEEPVKSKARKSKPQPASLSMFEWALEKEKGTVGAGR